MDAIEEFRIESALAAQAERDAAEDEVGQSDFLTMLVAQLENQDPLNPQDSADFAAQLAQFSSVEQLVAMRAGIDSLVASAGAADQPVAPSSGASGLDATNLVGKQVTVFGSQIEVDGGQSPVSMSYRSIDPAVQARVTLRDANGHVVHEESILPRLASGEESYLAAGDHVYRFDPANHNLPPGVYSIEFSAAEASGEAVTLLPMVEGLVTGAILAGEPAIRMGNRIFPVADVLEVNLPNTESVSGGSAGSVASATTGGAQNVYRPAPIQAPTVNRL